ncbi:MAG: LVIVD repeat-containing protein [Gemmatimonadota bacterium]
MRPVPLPNAGAHSAAVRLCSFLLSVLLLGTSACASSRASTGQATPGSSMPASQSGTSAASSSSDPRVGLAGGLFDAEEAAWNMSLVATRPPAEGFVGVSNSDLAFTGNYAIQGNYNGFQVWDISDPANPTLAVSFHCPASQSDVSVYQNLLFVSGEGMGGRLDCGAEGVEEAVSHHRLRGIRIFDITDITDPQYIGNVQTCRGSHTHSVLVDPDDDENVYIYVSGSAPVRPEEELPGCSDALPAQDPNSALFRIEVIKVPLANPEQAAIVSSPRIFQDLAKAPEHGPSPADVAELEEAKARGAFIIEIGGQEEIIPDDDVEELLTQVVQARGGTGPPTAADSTMLRQALPSIAAQMAGDGLDDMGPTQCHDITLYPEIGLAGGACGGYGLLIDISDPVHPERVAAVADSNFSYWHSATFNNDGTKALFSDEWGGGSQPKCRETDPMEWGADAIFTIADQEMEFQSYYKLPAPQTQQENCVAHNGSLIPIPGRDVMAQGWYQGGISVFDWTDPANPTEIAFFDRGPVDSTKMESGGSWSAYWYNGVIVSSEIARGLDIFQLEPSEYISQNEIDAAKTVTFDYFNTQGQQQFVWPASFALARAYVDQLERSGGLSADRIASVRQELSSAESASGSARQDALTALAAELDGEAGGSADAAKVQLLAGAVRDLAEGAEG